MLWRFIHRRSITDDICSTRELPLQLRIPTSTRVSRTHAVTLASWICIFIHHIHKMLRFVVIINAHRDRYLQPASSQHVSSYRSVVSWGNSRQHIATTCLSPHSPVSGHPVLTFQLRNSILGWRVRPQPRLFNANRLIWLATFILFIFRLNKILLWLTSQSYSG